MTQGLARTSRSLAVLTLSGLLVSWPAPGQQPFATTATTAAGEPPIFGQLITGQPIAENRGAAALSQSLKRLNTRASLMMITAHPDDEDGGMLAFESRGIGARTALFTLTRGEGGQNAMSAADYDALGLIRTNELLRADAYYGSQQYWGSVADYGFSKTMEEALGQWGHERVLYDAVRAVRLYRPLVVNSVFVGGVTDGHGHHQVAGMLAQEVFNAAADPKIFPDQIAAGLRPWKPLKVYARVPNFSISAKGMYDYATGKWAPVRFRDYVHGTWIDGTPATNVEIAEGTRDAILGETYFQVARRGLGEQKTQHEGPVVPLPGAVNVAYHRYGAALPGGAQPAAHEESFFDGIDVSLGGIASLAHGDAAFMQPSLAQIQELITTAMREYVPAAPSKLAPLLAEGEKRTTELIAQVKASSLSEDDKYNIAHELEIKRVQFNDALAEALGLQVAALVLPRTEATRFDPYAGSSKSLPLTPEDSMASVTPGEQFAVRIHAAMPPEVRLKEVSVRTPAGENWSVERVKPSDAPEASTAQNSSTDVLFNVTTGANAHPTAPYFSRASTEQADYDLLDPRWRNQSFAPYPVTGVVEFDYHGTPVRVAQVVQSMHRVVGLGAVYAPVIVTPVLSVTLQQSAGIVALASPTGITPAGHDFSLPVRVHSNAPGANAPDAAEGTLHLKLPDGWQATPAEAHFTLHGGEDQTIAFAVHPKALSTERYTIQAVAACNGHEYSDGYEPEGYPGLIPYNLYRSATYSVSGVDVRVAPGLNLGYVMGTGDDVPGALEELGVHAHLLISPELLTGDLSRYDVIVLGIRAYAARPELGAVSARLLEYVKGGGTVVVQYMSGEFDHDYGPYPYTLGSNPEKVVDERAPVVLLEPNHSLFTWPNRITANDFNGWVEERGHSFLRSWDPRYTALTETHDPGQDPQRGGLLYAHYGKGAYIYAAYALYRQTPEGVPGAFRVLANLISAGKNPPKAGATP